MRNVRLASVAIALASVVLFASPRAASALTASDETNLNGYLETLAANWDQAAANNAIAIFVKPEYSEADWRAYFEKYFIQTGHPYSDSLANFLQNPAFWAYLGTDVNKKFQGALRDSLWSLATGLLAAHPNDLGTAIAATPSLKQTLCNVYAYPTVFKRNGALTAALAQDFDARYRANFAAFPQYFSDATSVPPSTQPQVGYIRCQAWHAFLEMLPLDAARKAQIATTLELAGSDNLKKTIWDEHTVLLCDNGGLTSAQLSCVRSYLAAMPATLTNLRFASVMTFMGPSTEWRFPLPCSLGLVNIVGSSYSENSFPSDIAAHYSNGFSLVAVHEFNHALGGYQAQVNAPWSSRYNELIAQTGGVPMQFCRSMFVNPDGKSLFTTAPQEFFASMSNQYFGNTWRMLELAILRFDNGYKEPINQFLFFAETYSQGRWTIPVFTLGTDSVLSSATAAVGRDAQGRIVQLRRDPWTYTFTLDAKGNVVSYTTDAAPPEPPPPYGTDLVVSSLSASVSGRTITVTDEVKNVRGNPAGAFTVKYYLSMDAAITTSDRLLGSRSVAGLAYKAVSSATTTFTAPADLPPGSYFVGVVADTQNAVGEHDEANNSAASALAYAFKPDVVLSALSAKISSGKISISNTLRNDGVAATSGTTTVAFHLSADSVLSTSADALLGTRARTSALKVGATDGSSPSFAVPSGLAPGDYFVFAVADSKNAQAETDESNNVGGPTAKVSIRADLSVSSLSATVAGRTLAVKDTVKNTGPLAAGSAFRVDFYLSTDSTITTADVLLGSRTISSALGYNATNQATTTLSMPSSVAAGSYRVGAIVDGGNAILELLETNNTKASSSLTVGP